jgi:hypothetical protein
MPKLVLAAALLLKRPFDFARGAEAHHSAHEAMHARTRTRDATRRLRESHLHDAYFDLGPLDLTRRH